MGLKSNLPSELDFSPNKGVVISSFLLAKPLKHEKKCDVDTKTHIPYSVTQWWLVSSLREERVVTLVLSDYTREHQDHSDACFITHLTQSCGKGGTFTALASECSFSLRQREGIRERW